MIRKYLLNIHKFYHHHYEGEMDSPIMPSLVFSLTLTCILGILELLIFHGKYTTDVFLVNKYILLFPLFIILFFIFFWYKKRLPTKQELESENERYIGVSICFLLLILFLIVTEYSRQ